MDKSTVLSSTFNEQYSDNVALSNFKVPHLGKFSVIYDTENKGLSHFSSDENKGLQSIKPVTS